MSAVEIVEKSLELFSTLVSSVRQSTRAGGHILQNITMMGESWSMQLPDFPSLVRVSQSNLGECNEMSQEINLFKSSHLAVENSTRDLGAGGQLNNF